MNNHLIIDQQYKTQLEENYLRHIGHEYAQMLCDDLDSQEEQWKNIQFPESLNLWMTNFIKKEKKRNKKEYSLHYILKRVAVFILLFIGVNFLLITSVKAYRVQFMKSVVNFGERFLSVDYVPTGKDTSYLRPDAWENLYYLSYLPEGYTIKESKSSKMVAIIIYSNTEGDKIVFQQFFTGANMQINTEGAKVSNVLVHGEKSLLVEHPDITMMTWMQNDTALYLETHNLSSKEVIKIAESMKLVK